MQIDFKEVKAKLIEKLKNKEIVPCYEIRFKRSDENKFTKIFGAIIHEDSNYTAFVTGKLSTIILIAECDTWTLSETTTEFKLSIDIK